MVAPLRSDRPSGAGDERNKRYLAELLDHFRTVFSYKLYDHGNA